MYGLRGLTFEANALRQRGIKRKINLKNRLNLYTSYNHVKENKPIRWENNNRSSE